MKYPEIGRKIIWLDEVSSTNDYANAISKDVETHGVVVVANFQDEGRGQRGNSWESEQGKNLLCSILLWPTFLEVQNQFLLSKVASLAVCDVLKSKVANVSIKWPNDIYVNNCKIGGILIENSFSSPYLDSSIVGLGVNLNQKDFLQDLPNPTSLLLETGKEYSVKNFLDDLCAAFDQRFNSLIGGNPEKLSDDYFDILFRKDSYYNYRAEGEVFKAKIVGVKNSGELILETEKGTQRVFAFKEVSFVV
ncbi:MAG: biotin--[acetyl-CoA-carboxylase] ligase [Bacteroidales bacterium]